MDGIRRNVGAINIRTLNGELVNQIIDGDSPIQQICLNSLTNTIYIGRNELGISGPDASSIMRSDEKRLVARNIENGNNLFSFKAKLWRIKYLSLSLDNKILASSSSDGVVRLWDPYNGEIYSEVEHNVRGGYPLAFASDSKTLAYCVRRAVNIVSTH